METSTHLTTNVTEELKREGMARDFIRLVQTLRKDKDFNISDRIELSYQTSNSELAKALSENEKYIPGKSSKLYPPSLSSYMELRKYYK